MSEKNIYEELNDVDGSIDDFDRVELTDIEKAKYKKAFKSSRKKFDLKKIGVIAAALALGLFLFGQTGAGSYVYARVESALGVLTYPMAKALYLKEDVEPYVNVVNQVVENKGIAVKLTECAIDRDEMILTFLVESAGEKLQHANVDYDIYINGRKVNWGACSGGSGAVEDGVCFTNDSFDVKGIDRYEDLDVKIDIFRMDLYFAEEYDEESEGKTEPYIFTRDGVTYVENKREVRGNWVFNFAASGEELALNTKTIAIEETIINGDDTLVLEELTMNPVNKKIYGKLDTDWTKMQCSYKLVGEDDLGNEIEFGLSRYTTDDKIIIFNYEELHSRLADEAKSLTLTPYYVVYPKESGKMPSDYKPCGESFTINLND